jgi:glycosylphosphatidylinositol transamidase (GPIT) subunit GPI8
MTVSQVIKAEYWYCLKQLAKINMDTKIKMEEKITDLSLDTMKSHKEYSPDNNSHT